MLNGLLPVRQSVRNNFHPLNGSAHGLSSRLLVYLVATQSSLLPIFLREPLYVIAK